MSEQGLGLDYGEVALVAWNPRWPAAFEAVAATVRTALGATAEAVEHIGSTAVPGLVAKPILDVALALAPSTPIEPVVSALEAAGFEYRGDKDAGGHLFVLSPRPRHRVAHVHVVVLGDERWAAYLGFRDRLRADDAVRQAYADLKQTLAAEFPHDRGGYTAAKADFIRAVIT